MKAVKGYILTVFGPDAPEDEAHDPNIEEILAGRVLGDAEDTINDQLPDGYSVRIDEASLIR